MKITLNYPVLNENEKLKKNETRVGFVREVIDLDIKDVTSESIVAYSINESPNKMPTTIFTSEGKLYRKISSQFISNRKVPIIAKSIEADDYPFLHIIFEILGSHVLEPQNRKFENWVQREPFDCGEDAFHQYRQKAIDTARNFVILDGELLCPCEKPLLELYRSGKEWKLKTVHGSTVAKMWDKPISKLHISLEDVENVSAILKELMPTVSTDSIKNTVKASAIFNDKIDPYLLDLQRLAINITNFTGNGVPRNGTVEVTRFGKKVVRQKSWDEMPLQVFKCFIAAKEFCEQYAFSSSVEPQQLENLLSAVNVVSSDPEIRKNFFSGDATIWKVHAEKWLRRPIGLHSLGLSL